MLKNVELIINARHVFKTIMLEYTAREHNLKFLRPCAVCNYFFHL